MKQGRDRMLHPGVQRGREKQEELEAENEVEENDGSEANPSETQEEPKGTEEEPDVQRRLKCIYCGSSKNKVVKTYGTYTARIDGQTRRRRRYECESCRRQFITDELIIRGVSTPPEK